MVVDVFSDGYIYMHRRDAPVDQNPLRPKDLVLFGRELEQPVYVFRYENWPF